jgi:peptidoglycan/xylan/chitin deacetylase (PgdA/CDA1 family)
LHRCVDLPLKEGEEETILKAIDVVKRIVGYVPPPCLSVTQQMEGLCKFTGLQSPYAYEDLSLEEIKEQLILLEILVGVKAPADAEI